MKLFEDHVRHRRNSRRTTQPSVLAVTLFGLMMAGCAHQPVQDVSIASGVGPGVQGGLTDAPAAIGSGPYHYRYTLRGYDGKPQKGVPFALDLRAGKLPFVTSAKKVWQSETDEQGRTPVFALPFLLTDGQVFLRPRFGYGPFGEQMAFSSPDGAPLANVPYQLVICTEPPSGFVGRSDAQGNIVYAASQAPAKVKVTLLFTTLVGSDDPDEPVLTEQQRKLDDIKTWREACNSGSGTEE